MIYDLIHCFKTYYTSLLSLLAMVKCNSCSYQFNIWYIFYSRTIYYMDFWSREVEQELAPSTLSIDLVFQYFQKWCLGRNKIKPYYSFWIENDLSTAKAELEKSYRRQQEFQQYRGLCYGGDMKIRKKIGEFICFKGKINRTWWWTRCRLVWATDEGRWYNPI